MFRFLNDAKDRKSERNCDLEKHVKRNGAVASQIRSSQRNDLRKLSSEGMVNGLSLKSSERLPTCEICIMGKHSQISFPKVSSTKSKELLELIHSDVCGPFRTKSLGGASYLATFIYDKSNWVEVHFLKRKSEVKGAFNKFKAYVENQTERKIKILRTDNGLEYVGEDFTNDLERSGIKREHTIASTPQ